MHTDIVAFFLYPHRQPKTYHQGFLMVRVSGMWFTYDYASWEIYLSHLICLQLGYSQATETKVKRLKEEIILRAARGENVADEVEEKEGGSHDEKPVEVVWIQCMK